MSAPPKFREGDVCEFRGIDETRITRIKGVFPQTDDPPIYTHGYVDGPGGGSAIEPLFALLRRPVRVRDCIYCPTAQTPTSMRVVEIRKDDWLVARYPEPGRVPFSEAAIWFHADGTPIDPPPTAVLQSFAEMVDAIHPADAQVSSGMAMKVLQENERERFEFRLGIAVKEDPWMPEDSFALVSKGSILTGRLGDSIELAKIGAELVEERTLRRKFEKRANELSDLCGGLATKCSECVAERDEVLVENANLRRRVEHLERVANAEKTAKGFAPPSMLRVRRPR